MCCAICEARSPTHRHQSDQQVARAVIARVRTRSALHTCYQDHAMECLLEPGCAHVYVHVLPLWYVQELYIRPYDHTGVHRALIRLTDERCHGVLVHIRSTRVTCHVTRVLLVLPVVHHAWTFRCHATYVPNVIGTTRKSTREYTCTYSYRTLVTLAGWSSGHQSKPWP